MTPKKQPEEGDTLANFEKSVNELEALVEQLEAGDISLEESLQKFERGVQLARHCQQALKQAELRVEQLIERDGESQVAEFKE